MKHPHMTQILSYALDYFYSVITFQKASFPCNNLVGEMVSAIIQCGYQGAEWKAQISLEGIGLEVRDVGLQVFTLYFTDEKTALTLLLTNRDSL